MMKLGIPHMGSYSKIIASELGRLGIEVVVPPPNTNRSIGLGASCLNELVCLPAKTTLGNLIEAVNMGATDLLMFDSCGLCRLKCYWILQQRALDRLGHNVKVHPVRLGLRTPADIRRITGVSWLKAWRVFISVLRAIARSEPEQLPTGPPPQIGIVGEIFTVLDDEVNHRLFIKLQKLGCFVHNSIPLSYFIFKGLYRRGWMKRKDMDHKKVRQAEKMAHKIFPKDIGGHGNESIAHTIYYGLMGYDGVVHCAPFPCMPEFTVASIVDDMAREYSMAILHFTFDVHTADAGIITRLEAFVDMLQRKRRVHYQMTLANK